MFMRRLIGLSGVLPLMFALMTALPGCGGDSAAPVNAEGEVELAPTVNPAPGVVPNNEEFNPD